jgi:hypothetical protein
MNLYVSLMRMIVPLVAGAVLTALVHLGVSYGSADVTAVVTAVLTGAYYTLFRLLEQLAGRIGNRTLAIIAGLLLGYIAPPDYPTVTAARARRRERVADGTVR